MSRQRPQGCQWNSSLTGTTQSASTEAVRADPLQTDFISGPSKSIHKASGGQALPSKATRKYKLKRLGRAPIHNGPFMAPFIQDFTKSWRHWDGPRGQLPLRDGLREDDCISTNVSPDKLATFADSAGGIATHRCQNLVMTPLQSRNQTIKCCVSRTAACP